MGRQGSEEKKIKKTSQAYNLDPLEGEEATFSSWGPTTEVTSLKQKSVQDMNYSRINEYLQMHTADWTAWISHPLTASHTGEADQNCQRYP